MTLTSFFILTGGDAAEALVAWLALIITMIASAIMSVVHWYQADPLAASAKIVATLGAIRLGMVWLEGYLIIWIPQTSESRFWAFWVRLMQTLDHGSMSSPRQPHAIRALHKWDKGRKEAQALKELNDAPIDNHSSK